MLGIVIPCYFRTEFKEAEKSKTQLNTAKQNRSNYTVVTAHTRNHVGELSRKLQFIHANGSENNFLTCTKCSFG